jgi:hypothetical protein
LEKRGLTFIVDIEENVSAHFVFIQFENAVGLEQFYLEVFGMDIVDFYEMIKFGMI